MKANGLKLAVTTAVVLIATIQGARSQGSFQDLNFDQGTIVNDPDRPGFVLASAALPGWTVYTGTYYNLTPQTDILHNSMVASGAGPSVSIYDYYSKYEVLLQNGALTTTTGFGAIAQTGFVPAGTQSLIIDAPIDQGISVTLGGQSLGFSRDTDLGGNYWIASIPWAAGTTEKLQIMGYNNNQSVFIESLQFVTPAPEPSTSAMLLLGAASTFVINNRRRRRSPGGRRCFNQ